MEKTARGFSKVEFEDFYGAKCSMQKSSLANVDCIWLGVDDPDPQIMASQAHLFGVETKKACGWVSFPVPKEVSITTRMHLTKEQAAVLIEQLRVFVETGDL